VKVMLRYFAALRESLGPGGPTDWPIPAGEPATVAGLRTWLAAQSTEHARMLAAGRAVRVAVDQALVDECAPVPEGAEVAFFPPVTGG